MDIYNDILKLCADVRLNEPMKKHTSFRIGGAAEIFCEPQNENEIKSLIEYFKENKIPYIVLGNGSNVLVSDDGIKEAVIKIGDRMSSIQTDGDKMTVMAGAMLSGTARAALAAELTGIEALSGIPGSIGGAVYMNAGAYGTEMSDVVSSVTCLLQDGEIKKITSNELDFGYRKSIFTKNNAVILSCELQLKKGNKAEIEAQMKEFTKRRNDKQPLNYPSAGSTFKRPEGYFAGKLIEDCGLKGYRIGGAMISEKHAGFVINYDNASAKDVVELMKYAQSCVMEKFGVKIEPEIKLLGISID